jgi:hypothetical protein
MSVWPGENIMTSPYQWVVDWTEFKPANAFQRGWTSICNWADLVLCCWRFATSFAGAGLMAITFNSFTETNLVGAMDLPWFLVAMLGCKLYYSYPKPDEMPTSRLESGTLQGQTFTFDR